MNNESMHTAANDGANVRASKSGEQGHAVLHKGELDHLLWAVPDLASGVEEFADLTGVQPRIGGSHPWTGTRNALVYLGGVLYLEIVAPDFEQDLEGTIGGALIDVKPGLWTFAHSYPDLPGLIKTASDAGYSVAGPNRWNRRGRDGSFFEWAVGFAGETEFGPAAPFYVDWENLTHPTTKMQDGLTLRSITAYAPDPEALRAFYRTVGIDIDVAEGPAGVSAEVDGPRGTITLDPLDRSQHPLLRSTPAYMFRDEAMPPA